MSNSFCLRNCFENSFMAIFLKILYSGLLFVRTLNDPAVTLPKVELDTVVGAERVNALEPKPELVPTEEDVRLDGNFKVVGDDDSSLTANSAKTGRNLRKR